jgi:two-component system sensor histidine kinase/response regulator
MNTTNPTLPPPAPPAGANAPTHGRDARATSDAAPDAPPAEASPATILVVDDQPANLQIAGAVLGGLGCEIIPATDGATALKRMAVRRPDLILLDLLMPGMGGCEVCRQLKANPDWQDIPVVFLSAADDKELIVRALEAGGVDYLTKPFHQAELISRVRTHLALKTARDQLRQLAEDKDELLGVLAHDLKNYLGGMNLTAGLLCRQTARFQDERVTQLAENLLRTSAQSLAFVKEFLANAAADHGFAARPAPVNLAHAAAAAAQQHAEAARQKKINVRTEFPSEAVVVLADVSALGQVLDNLVSNALKFSPPGKSVYVSVRPLPQAAECVVRDEGPGFTAEDKARMFRRYGRLSARPTGGEPSTGLGLSIVRKLVLGMGGELTCDSHPGQGAAFSVRLPKPQAN